MAKKKNDISFPNSLTYLIFRLKNNGYIRNYNWSRRPFILLYIRHVFNTVLSQAAGVINKPCFIFHGDM